MIRVNGLVKEEMGDSPIVFEHGNTLSQIVALDVGAHDAEQRADEARWLDYSENCCRLYTYAWSVIQTCAAPRWAATRPTSPVPLPSSMTVLPATPAA